MWRCLDGNNVLLNHTWRHGNWVAWRYIHIGNKCICSHINALSVSRITSSAGRHEALTPFTYIYDSPDDGISLKCTISYVSWSLSIGHLRTWHIIEVRSPHQLLWDMQPGSQLAKASRAWQNKISWSAMILSCSSFGARNNYIIYMHSCSSFRLNTWFIIPWPKSNIWCILGLLGQKYMQKHRRHPPPSKKMGGQQDHHFCQLFWSHVVLHI